MGAAHEQPQRSAAVVIANLSYRVEQLEQQTRESRERQDQSITDNRRDLDAICDKVEQNSRICERGLSTALRRIDTLALKIGLIGTLGGMLGYAILEFLVQKLAK